MPAYITDNQNHLTLQLIKINPQKQTKKIRKVII